MLDKIKKTCWIVWSGFQVAEVCETEAEAKKAKKKYPDSKIQETYDDFRD